MYENNALGVDPHAEGVVVSGAYYNRASSVVAGGDAGLRAGVGGLSIGRFGWAEPDGRVLNQRVSPEGLLGLVVIQQGDWRRVYWDDLTCSWKIREGLNVTMISRAPGMWVKFPNGAPWGARVYTNPLDGIPVAGDTGGLEATLWSVGRAFGSSGLTLITTWNPLT